ncbi:2OG-Fe(II) oxygenase family protein [Salinarimonas chemoclinalis]|uniref:2OG-Fe(II) oxygenase family protein n=1 Tax=Salinarimonas chemoclinalis TaxID=3241599 RepID=UPI003558763D
MTIASPTARAPVTLPPMPSEREAAAVHEPIRMARAALDGERLVFSEPHGFARAISEGFFLLAVPEGFDPGPGDRFARHFFEEPRGDANDVYRGYRSVAVPGDYQGYFDRPHDQWENFYIERGNWNVLPPDVARMGAAMSAIGIRVLRAVLSELAIPQDCWPAVTGGLSDFAGHQMLAFNHFRSDRPVRGSKFHRDSGWVTVLRSTDRGLLAYIDGRLRAVDPQPGFLIVNFGSSIEVFTERSPQPVRANVHGVVRTERDEDAEDRVSFVTFLDSALDGTIHRWEDGRPVPLQSVVDFAVQEVQRTYDGDDATL